MSKTPSQCEKCDTISYGVDWSSHAYPTSHCWFPYEPSYPSTSQLCTYATCSNFESKISRSFAECRACGVVVHRHHLNDSHTTKDNILPPCRPSFIDDATSEKSHVSEKDNSSSYDQHFWSQVSVLPEPCANCKRKSTPKTSLRSETDRAPTILSSNANCQDVSMVSLLSGRRSTGMAQFSNGLVCLWCSRSYHRCCWEYLLARNEEFKCDYGLFGYAFDQDYLDYATRKVR